MKKGFITIITIVIGALMVPTLFSCGGPGGNMPFVSRSVLENSQAENDSLRGSLKALENSFAKQNAELSHILSEIADISNRTSLIRVANDEMPLDDVALVNEDLEAIRSRIAKLEKESEKARKINRSYAVAQRTITELRETVRNLEIEISSLKAQLAKSNETISSQDRTIRQQDNRISKQSDTISLQLEKITRQKDELERIVNLQTELLYSAGIQMSKIADEGDFKISGRKNKHSVNQYRISIYSESFRFYSEAAHRGHLASIDSMTVVRAKIQRLSSLD